MQLLPDRVPEFCAFWATRRRIMERAAVLRMTGSARNALSTAPAWDCIAARLHRDGAKRLAATSRRPEDNDPLGRAAGNADAVDRTADQLPAVGHQHDLVAFLDREGRHQPAVAFGD